MRCVARARATHVLIQVLPTEEVAEVTGLGCAKVSVRHNGVVVHGIAVRYGDVTGFYHHIDDNVSIINPVLKRNLSMIYSMASGIHFNSNSITPYLEKVFDVDYSDKVNKFRKMPHYERSKVTAQHHTHLRPDEVMEAAQRVSVQRTIYCMIAVERLRTANIKTEAVVATFLTYVLTASERFVKLILYSKRLWKVRNEDALNGALKACAAQLKSAHSKDADSLTELFELPVLMNRGIGSVDWVKERDHRVNPDVVNVDPGKVYAKCRELFNSAIDGGYKYRKMNIDEYVQSRWEWVPGGSVHSQYDDDKPYIFPGQFTRNKFITLNSMPKHAIKRMFSSEPEVRAWTSTKYEWGKQRAIYGTDLRSTVITNFAMYRCEEVLTHKFPVGDQAEAGKVHRRVMEMLNGYESFCFDYDDFNAQHSLDSMQAVLVAYYDSFKNTMTAEQQSAMQWVIQSAKNMYVLDPATDSWYQLKGTLLSGWRLTTFMNTILNWVYMAIAGVFETGGVHDSVHNGDDVMISVSTIGSAVKVMEKMRGINARAQEAKCNLFSISEFLRIEHGMSGKDGLGAQYLTRSCATLVHSRIESNEPISLIRVLEADQTRLRDLEARTEEKPAVEALKAQLIKRAAKLFDSSVKICKSILGLHHVVGGLNLNRWSDVHKKVTVETGEFEIPYEIDDPSFWPGVHDYTKMVFDKLEGYVTYKQILNAVVTGSRLTIAKRRSAKVKLVDNDNIKLSRWERAMYKAYKGINVSYYTNMSKFIGIPPISTLAFGEQQFFLNAVRAASNPLRAMSLLL